MDLYLEALMNMFQNLMDKYPVESELYSSFYQLCTDKDSIKLLGQSFDIGAEYNELCNLLKIAFAFLKSEHRSSTDL